MAYDEENLIQSVKYVGLFNFEHPACKAQNDISYNDNDEEMYYLKVKLLENKNVTLIYKDDVGLKKIDPKTKEELLPISSIPLSSQAIAFASEFKKKSDTKTRQYTKSEKSRNQHVTELIAYFDKFGYLFKQNSFGKYRKVSYEVVGNLLDRIYFLSDLMSECRTDEYKRDYNKIFYYTFYLLLGRPKKARAGEEDDEPTPLHFVHPIADQLQSVGYTDYPPNDSFYYDDFDDLGEIDISRIDKENKFYVVRDYFLDGQKVGVDTRNYDSDVLNPHSYYGDDSEAQLYQAHITRRIDYAYVYYDKEERSIKLVYDFLYHFIKDITPISDISFQAYKTLALSKEVNLNTDPKFNKHYKEVLLDIATDAIKKEVEYALRNVHPVLKKESLTPGWDIPDLYSAIHYSLLLTNGTMKIYRVCENPNCCNLYPVTVTNKKQKFCSNRCRAAASQRSSRYRSALEKEGIVVEKKSRK